MKIREKDAFLQYKEGASKNHFCKALLYESSGIEMPPVSAEPAGMLSSCAVF